MSEHERCPVCDAVLATEADVRTYASGILTRAEVEALCWARFNPPKSCVLAPVDWRARALAAEARVAELQRERDSFAERLAVLGGIIDRLERLVSE